MYNMDFFSPRPTYIWLKAGPSLLINKAENGKRNLPNDFRQKLKKIDSIGKKRQANEIYSIQKTG